MAPARRRGAARARGGGYDRRRRRRRGRRRTCGGRVHCTRCARSGLDLLALAHVVCSSALRVRRGGRRGLVRYDPRRAVPSVDRGKTTSAMRNTASLPPFRFSNGLVVVVVTSG